MSVEIEGLKEAQEAVKALPDKIKRKILMAAFRKASKPLINAAQANALRISKSDGTPAKMKRLSKAIGGITGKSKANPTLYVGPRAKGAYKSKDKSGWFGHLFEQGTKVRRNKKGQNRGRILESPYMKPAYDTTKTQVSNSIGNEVLIQVRKLDK